MRCPFIVGQKVQCVRNTGLVLSDEILTVGQIYTIRDIGPIPDWQISVNPHVPPGTIGVRLVGVVRNRFRQNSLITHDDEEAMFDWRRFRPLQSRNTDISALTALLNTAPESVDA